MQLSILEENIIRLKLIPTIGNKTLINIFRNINFANEKKLDFLDIKQFLSQSQQEKFKLIDEAYLNNQILKLIQNIERNNIKIFTIFDTNYPLALSKIYSPPIIIFTKGNVDYDYEKSIAVVGTRKYSDYGKSECQKFVASLEDKGFTIVSGLAAGIDSIALSSGLKSNIKCIGVIGSGFDYIYPYSNKKLYQDIVENDGAIITEYFPFEAPLPGFFPARNRIIAGLSKSTFVIEAAEKSGSLITAASAFEEGRDVFALPADITRIQSQGCNEIIRKGIAKLIWKPEDILQEYGISKNQNSIGNHFDFITNEEHRNILNQININPQSTDELMNFLKVNINNLNILLTEMEVLGMIQKGIDDKWRIN